MKLKEFTEKYIFQSAQVRVYEQVGEGEYRPIREDAIGVYSARDIISGKKLKAYGDRHVIGLADLKHLAYTNAISIIVAPETAST